MAGSRNVRACHVVEARRGLSMRLAAVVVGITLCVAGQPDARGSRNHSVSSRGSTAAQHHDEHPVPADFNEPIRLYTAVLGKFTRPISSPNPQARAYFNQGFQLMYAFARVEAGRSFREAQRRDPTCAICYWGEAWAWGSYLNRPMTVPEAPRAYAAIQKAIALAEAHASPIEKALIQAMTVRYVASFDPAKRVEQDFAYAQAMGRVAEAYPADLDAATLYSEALILLLPRPGLIDLNHPVMLRLLRVLEGALKRDIRHPGACHFYAHATELTTQPERAEACVEFLGSSMPRCQSHQSHAVAHMEQGRQMGRCRARQSPGVAHGSEGRDR